MIQRDCLPQLEDCEDFHNKSTAFELHSDVVVVFYGFYCLLLLFLLRSLLFLSVITMNRKFGYNYEKVDNDYLIIFQPTTWYMLNNLI